MTTEIVEPWVPGPTWRLTCTKEELLDRLAILDKHCDFLLDQRQILKEQIKRTDNIETQNDINEELEELKTKLGDYLAHVQILKNMRNKFIMKK